MYYLNPRYIDLLTLKIDKIIEGQLWRLFTYLFIPPLTHFIFLFFALYLLYIFGSALEAEWGSFRLNIYYFLGMICTTIIGCILPGEAISNIYVNTSLFLAFATIFPNFQLYIFFLIPVKVKYLALLTGCGILLTILAGPLVLKLTSLVSMINYLLFFWPDIRQRLVLSVRARQTAVSLAKSQGKAFHECFSCNKTEHDDHSLIFRVCVQCSKEFCSAHLKGHTH